MLAPATVTNMKIRYDAKTPQFAIFGTRVCVFYSTSTITLATQKMAAPCIIAIPTGDSLKLSQA